MTNLKEKNGVYTPESAFFSKANTLTLVALVLSGGMVLAMKDDINAVERETAQLQEQVEVLKAQVIAEQIRARAIEEEDSKSVFTKVTEYFK